MNQEFWNQRYASEEFAYGLYPNVLLKRLIEKMPSGKILFPAEGEGRNAVFCATRGWDVSAFDITTSGKQKSEILALKNNVEIKYTVNSFVDSNYPENHFDVIALIFSHLPAEIRQKSFRRIIPFLKPGGILIVIGFSNAQLGKKSGGPKELNMLFSADVLREDFNQLHSMEVETCDMEIDEGPYHQGLASLIQFTAIK